MQVTETLSDGLRREFKIVIPADAIDEKVVTRLAEVGKEARLPGFRPGKVPMKVLRQRFSKHVMGEVLEGAVNEATQSTLEERALRPAQQPKIEVTSFDEGKDLEYTVALEVLPEVEAVDLSGIAVERPTYSVGDEEVEESLQRLVYNNKQFEAVEGRAAETGDRIKLDFDGSVDGEKRPGMQAEGSELEIGSGRFIPGFEEQLVGAKAGDAKTVTVTFPEDYPVDDLKGKEAVFECTVHEVQAPKEGAADDDFAKTLGFDDLAGLKADVTKRLQEQYDQFGREKAKRSLLDALHEKVSFEVPPSMVATEFEQIWRQVEDARKRYEEAKANGEEVPTDTDLEKPEETLREEYQAIAERRVRLGLLLADIGTKNEIQVPQEELQQAMIAEARKYPGQEQQVFNLFRENPQALESLRAPLFENKVVDYILELADVTDKPVTKEELMADPDEPAAADDADGAEKKTDE